MLTYNYTNLVVVNVTKIAGLTLLNVFNKQFNSMLLGLHTLMHLEILSIKLFLVGLFRQSNLSLSNYYYNETN